MKSSMNSRFVIVAFLLFLFCLPESSFGQLPEDPDRVIIIIDDGQKLGFAPVCYPPDTAMVLGAPNCLVANEGDSTVDILDSLYVEINPGERYDLLGIRYRISDGTTLMDVSSPAGNANPFVLEYDLTRADTSFTAFEYTLNGAVCEEGGEEVEGWDAFTTKVPYTVGLPADFPISDELTFEIVIKGKKTGGPWEDINDIEFTAEVCPFNSFRKASPVEEVSQLKVSPNPFSQQLSLQWLNDAPDLSEIRLIDVQGRTVIQEEWNSIQGSQLSLNTQDLPVGIYVLQVKSGTQVVNHKLIKAN